MKLPRLTKKTLIISIVVLILIIVGVVFAIQVSKDEEPVKQFNTSDSSQEKQAKLTPQTAEVEAQPKEAVIPEPSPQPEPKYGETPDSPGFYKVFDQVWVMDQANIAVADRQYVTQMVGGWTYKSPNTELYLCGAGSRDKLASVGADYDTNPVTQLKWCAQYAQERYNGWAAAHAFREQHHYW
jgi:hypothetical protein